MSITNEVETTPEERAPGATAAPSAPGAEAKPNAPDAFDLLLQVGRALHTYGTPAPELERTAPPEARDSAPRKRQRVTKARFDRTSRDAPPRTERWPSNWQRSIRMP